MSSNQEINLNSAIKKLIATKFPSIKMQNPATKAIAICAENFIELLVQTTASISNDKQKNMITTNTVLEALEQLEFNSIAEKAKEINTEITSNIKKQRESWKSLKMPEISLTEEEAAREMEELRNEALRVIEERKKKEEESKAKVKDD